MKNRYSCKKTTRRNHIKAGFSLLEVLVASSLMVLVFACVMRSMRLGNNSVETAQITTLASQYLQDEAERIRALNWSAIQALPNSEYIDVPDHFSISKIAEGEITLKRSVEDISGYPTMKQVSIEATWVSHRGIPSKRKIVMRYAKDGIYDYYYGTL